VIELHGIIMKKEKIMKCLCMLYHLKQIDLLYVFYLILIQCFYKEL